MIYAMSDIHGDYEKYRRLLQAIDLRPSDTLYVLGDVVDRGPEPMKILRDMMCRLNVVPILGNHKFMMAYCLRFLLKEITDETVAELNDVQWTALQEWFQNGGRATLAGFHRLSPKERIDVWDYLGEFSLYEEVRAGGKSYLLVHPGLDNFSPDRPLADYALHELIFGCPDYEHPYYPDRYVVTGHTPTQAIPCNPAPGRIFRQNNHIAIDCGCGYGGPLAAVCLDTGAELYV